MNHTLRNPSRYLQCNQISREFMVVNLLLNHKFEKMKKLLMGIVLCQLFVTSYSQEADSIRNYEIDEVVVLATRSSTRLKDIPQKVEIIDEIEINSIPSENLVELLKKKTNLDIIQYPGVFSSIGMRGFSPSAHSRSYSLFLINGKPSGTTNLASMNTDHITRIEIVKGPYSVLYGSDAMGGVINIITKEEGNTGGDVAASVGSFGSLNFNGQVTAAVSDHTIFQLGFARKDQLRDYRIGKNNLLRMTDLEKNILDKTSYGETMQNTRFHINHINGSVRHSINETWSIGAEAIYTIANDIETPGNYWGSYGQSKKDIERLNLYGSVTRSTGSNILSVSPYYNSESNANYTNNSDTGFVSFNSHIQEYGLKMQDNISLNKFKLLVGADVDVYNYGSERFKDKATPTNPYSPDHKNTKAAVFSQLAFASSSFSMNAGGRLDYITYDIEKNDSLNGTGGEATYYAFNPSVGAQYEFPFQLKLHGSFGTAFSVPDAFKVAGYYSVSEYFAAWDFWWVKNYIGNPDLKPESSATYDFGISYSTPDKLFTTDLTYFHTDHKDKIIEYTLGGDTTSYKNANNSRMSGLEIMMTTNIGVLFDNNFKLEFYANYTHMIENEVDETMSDISGSDSLVIREMLYTRRSNGNFGVFFDSYRGFSTRLHARYIGSRLERDNFSALRPDITPSDYYAEGGYTASDKILLHPNHLLFDYSVYYTLQGNKRFGITISNLFDENYTEKDGYNMVGRMITGSFKYSF